MPFIPTYVISVSLLFFVNSVASATTLKLSADNQDKIEGVNIPKNGQLTVGPQDKTKTYDLTLTGYGVRAKKLGLFSTKVYVAASYANIAGTVTDPLETIKKSPA